MTKGQQLIFSPNFEDVVNTSAYCYIHQVCASKKKRLQLYNQRFQNTDIDYLELWFWTAIFCAWLKKGVFDKTPSVAKM
jgi:hypothetical protein